MILQNKTCFHKRTEFQRGFLNETKKLWEPLLGHPISFEEAQELIEKSLIFVDWFINQQTNQIVKL